MQILCIYPQNAPFPVLLLLAKIASMLVRFVCMFVCLSVCLSVHPLAVTVLVSSLSKLNTLFVMHVSQFLSMLVTIWIKFWIQDSFEFFANIGVDGHSSHFHSLSSQISHEILQNIHTAAATMV